MGTSVEGFVVDVTVEEEETTRFKDFGITENYRRRLALTYRRLLGSGLLGLVDAYQRSGNLRTVSQGARFMKSDVPNQWQQGYRL